jgi:hypothetical protein
MTTPITVNLDIHAWASSPNDGYTNTACSDGTIYSYKWTGGTDGKGNVIEHLQSGNATDINVESVADRRFILIDAQLSPGTTQFQISIQNTFKALIHDIGTANEDDHFKLQFRDDIEGHNARTFWCDPGVRNDN